MKENIQKDYFNWICRLAFPDNVDRQRYGCLLHALASVDFIFLIPLDENRTSDGIDLRYRFCYEQGLQNEAMEGVFDAQHCSVLEMMIALALRCDEHIMFDSDIGGRTNVWFYIMLKNLNLDVYTNEHFNHDGYLEIISRLLNREYDYNGNGGLFILQNPKIDMRVAEIWYQLCWYLAENF